jgi:hypothetical protein
MDWLWQPLNLASAHATRQFDASYFTREKVISSISAGLHDAIRSNVAVPQPGKTCDIIRSRQ